LNEFAKSILNPNFCPETKEHFDFEGINRMFIDHVERKKYNLNLIWALITFQIWVKNYL